MNLTTIKNVAPSAAVALGALALVSTLVVRTSDAAFTDTVNNTGNSFQAGQVELTTDATSALFAVPAMEPGQSVTECLVVRYGGNIADPQPVALRTIDTGTLIGDTALAPYLQLSILEGPANQGCAFADGDGVQLLNPGETLAAFAANRRTYETGATGSFDPSIASGDVARGYRFTVTLAADTPNELQNLGLTDVEFVWEISS